MAKDRGTQPANSLGRELGSEIKAVVLTTAALSSYVRGSHSHQGPDECRMPILGAHARSLKPSG